ncbi:MAG TPA: tetratricopeptide repeat protein, partial [Nitrospiria bacterium]|nr:tetratricopeptide repeat protein [Nitrospiria bacterium]
MIQEGINLMDRGDLTAAQQRFEEAVRQDPADYRARYYLGEVFFRRRQFDEAKAQFREALRIKPDAQSVRFELGLIAEEEERYDEAYDLHREVIAKAPGTPAAKASADRLRLFGGTREAFRASHEHFAAANRLIAQGKFDAGEAELRVVIQLAPGNINALSLLGRILLQSKKNEEAIQIFEQLVRLNPNAVGTLYQLALLYEERQEFDRAIAAYKEIIARGKGTPQADAAKKKLAIIGEDPASAKRGFELFESGEKALKDGKLDDARRYYQEVLAL